MLFAFLAPRLTAFGQTHLLRANVCSLQSRTCYKSDNRRFSIKTRSQVVATMANSTTSTKFNLALCQIPVIDDKEVNLSVAKDYLLRAHQQGAHLAVLPECFNCPYGTQYFADYAEELPAVGGSAEDQHGSKSLGMLQNVAKQTGMYIVGGSIPEISEDEKVYNCSLTVSPDGNLVAKHRKVHLFDIDVPGGIRFKESDVLSAGSSVTVFSAEQLGCSIGVGICYDMRFPDLAMVQTRQLGAKVLIYPGAFNMTTGPVHWELLLRARALDNQVYMAACSPARNEDGDGYIAWGHSAIVNPWGSVIAATDENAGIVFAEIDLEKVDGVRRAIPMPQQRRGDMYELRFVGKEKE